MMKVRFFTSEDYPMICKWWVDHRHDAVALECLSKTGIIVNDICAGFLFKTDSAVALMEYIVSDPQSEKEFRRESLDHLIELLVSEAKKSGFSVIFTSFESIALCERLKSKHDFTTINPVLIGMGRKI
jgi:hypothetical protein